MEKFMGTPGSWDVNTEENTILSDAGYVVAKVDVVHGVPADVILMSASKNMLKALQALIDSLHSGSAADIGAAGVMAHAAINKALGKE